MSSGLTIAFDADDTLWHNENAFAAAEDRFNKLVEPWADPAQAQEQLIAYERSHVGLYGYGVKSFTLSMVAAACDISDNQVPAATLRQIVDTGNELLAMDTVLIDGALDALQQVSKNYRTMIITKGDLHHQMRRIQVADVAPYCFDVEVVADKDVATYSRILRRHGIEPDRFVMIGNSIVSDVAPVVEAGGRAVHIPYDVTWALEQATEELPPSDQWFTLDSIRDIPALIGSLT